MNINVNGIDITVQGQTAIYTTPFAPDSSIHAAIAAALRAQDWQVTCIGGSAPWSMNAGGDATWVMDFTRIVDTNVSDAASETSRTLRDVIIVNEYKGAMYLGDITITPEEWVVKASREKRGRQWEAYPFGEQRFDQNAPKFAFTKIAVYQAIDDSEVIEAGVLHDAFTAERWSKGDLICKNYK